MSPACSAIITDMLDYLWVPVLIPDTRLMRFCHLWFIWLLGFYHYHRSILQVIGWMIRGSFVRRLICRSIDGLIQYIPRNMHTDFALLCFVVVIHWLIFPYPLGLLHWHCGNLTIAPVSAKQAWWIWINTSCEFIMNDCITTTKQSTTKPCAYFLGYTVFRKTQWHAAILPKSTLSHRYLTPILLTWFDLNPSMDM